MSRDFLWLNTEDFRGENSHIPSERSNVGHPDVLILPCSHANWEMFPAFHVP